MGAMWVSNKQGQWEASKRASNATLLLVLEEKTRRASDSEVSYR